MRFRPVANRTSPISKLRNISKFRISWNRQGLSTIGVSSFIDREVARVSLLPNKRRTPGKDSVHFEEFLFKLVTNVKLFLRRSYLETEAPF